MTYNFERNVEALTEMFRRHDNKTDNFFESHLLARLDAVVDGLTGKNSAPVRIVLALPIVTENGEIMTFKLAKGTADIMIMMMNAEGEMVPAVAKDTFTAKSSDPALGAIIATMPSGEFVGKPSLRISAIPPVKTKTGLKVTVSDTGGMAPADLEVEITGDITATAIKLDETHAIFTP